MEVDEAVDFFASMPNISHPLQLLKDVGLGYLTLGQPSPRSAAANRCIGQQVGTADDLGHGFPQLVVAGGDDEMAVGRP